MESNGAINQSEFNNLFYEFSDETLEIAAEGETAGGITVNYCTAFYFCPGP
jgi:hypothetical protein